MRHANAPVRLVVQLGAARDTLRTQRCGDLVHVLSGGDQRDVFLVCTRGCSFFHASAIEIINQDRDRLQLQWCLARDACIPVAPKPRCGMHV